MGSWVLGKGVGEIVIGARKSVIGSRSIVQNGFVGCVKVMAHLACHNEQS